MIGRPHRRRCDLAHSPLLLVGIGAAARSGSASRWRRCRSTCGRPTSTKARRRRSPPTWRRRSRRRRSPRFLRVWLEAFPAVDHGWHPAVWWAGHRHDDRRQRRRRSPQRNIKRMLAYSSIAHAGYLLVAVAAGTHAGSPAHAVLPAGLHAGDVRRVRGHHRDARDRATRPVMIDDFAGLWSVRPWLAVGMARPHARRCSASRSSAASASSPSGTCCRPPSRRPSRRRTLAVVLVLTTVVSAGYYLYVVMVMFMKPRPRRRGRRRRHRLRSPAPWSWRPCVADPRARRRARTTSPGRPGGRDRATDRSTWRPEHAVSPVAPLTPAAATRRSGRGLRRAPSAFRGLR